MSAIPAIDKQQIGPVKMRGDKDFMDEAGGGPTGVELASGRRSGDRWVEVEGGDGANSGVRDGTPVKVAPGREVPAGVDTSVPARVGVLVTTGDGIGVLAASLVAVAVAGLPDVMVAVGSVG